MTCVYMEGFESVADDTDLVRRGWVTPTLNNVSGASALGIASRTPVAGRGLMLKGPYGNATTLPCSSNTTPDFGMLNTGKSIYSLWQAGGFSIGFNATFNKVSQVQVASTDTFQIVYDGSQYYWAILFIGAVFTVGYSTDLVNWTPCQSVPPAISVNNASLSVQGSGLTATVLLSWTGSVTATTSYYTKDGGRTWSAMASVGTSTRGVILTTAPAAPALGVAWIASTGFRICYFSSLSATPIQLATPALTGNVTYANAFLKVVSGVIIAMGSSLAASAYVPQSGTSYFASCLQSSDPTVPANWQTVPACVGQVKDITFFNNQWIAVGYGGINASPQAGTPAAVQGPTGVWTQQLSTGTNSIWSIACNNTICVAVGGDPANATLGAIWTSTNGTTWTKTNRFILSSASFNPGSNFTDVIWDGSKFVLTGGQNNNVIATSIDGVSWNPIYYPDYAEATGTSCCSLLGAFSGTLNASGTYAPWSASAGALAGVGFSAGAVVAATNTRPVNPATTSGTGVYSALTPTASVPLVQLSHYYELIATATGTVNQFNIQWALDGVIQGTINPALQFAIASDTAGLNQLLLNLPRTGNWVMIDDIYVSTMNGANNVGQLGVVNVFPWTPVSDTTLKQMSATSGTLSHAAQVAGALSNAANSVYTSTNGAKDVYNVSSPVPANWTVNAVQADAFFSKNGYVGGNGAVGIVSKTTELDAPPVVALGANPTYASITTDTDPNTGAPWTLAALNSAGIAVAKTS
jgi:hypothetical protein